MDPALAHLRAYLGATASLPGGTLEERDGLRWCRTPIPWPTFNGAIAAPELGSCDDAAAVVAELAAAGRPWFWWALADTPDAVVEAATRAGATEYAREPWMEARIADLEKPVLPAGVTLAEVADERGFRLWAATMREIYGFSEAGEHAWVMQAELAGWTGLPWRQWIAFADGEPVGVTLLCCGGGVGGLYSIGVKPAARGRGIGRLLTLFPLEQSGEELAGLFATPAGAALYERLGFVRRGWVSRLLGR